MPEQHTHTPPKSKKKEQLKIIGKKIKDNLVGCINKYELILLDSQNPDFIEFRKLIRNYLNINHFQL